MLVVVVFGAWQYGSLEGAARGIHVGLSPHPHVVFFEHCERAAFVSLKKVFVHEERG